MEDLNKILTFEVKKELADRYFGFRKIIEEDTNDYQKKIIASTLDLERKIGFSLVCLYILLREEGLVNQFSTLTGVDSSLFFDPYVNQSPTIRRQVLHRCRIHGFTRKRRFLNLFFDSYRNLEHYIEEYRHQLVELMADHDTIKEEIDIFYKKNDISGIMLFLRGIDGTTPGSAGGMEGALDSGRGLRMEEKMRVKPPTPVEKLLPVLPPLPAFDSIQKKLKELALTAFTKQPDFDPRTP